MKLFLTVMFMSLGVLGFGQSLKAADVPAAVIASFTQAYPQAEEAEWGKEGNSYEVNFETKDNEMSIVYDAQGNWLETETELRTDQLPDAVKATLKSDFKRYKIKEAAKTESKDGIQYEAELTHWWKTKDVLFNADGKVLRNPFAKKGSNEEDDED